MWLKENCQNILQYCLGTRRKIRQNAFSITNDGNNEFVF